MFRANRNLFEVDEGVISAEASTIGLKPGEWPEQMLMVHDEGNVYIYEQDYVQRNEELGEICYVEYVHPSPELPVARIYND